MDATEHQQTGWLLGDILNLAMAWGSCPPGSTTKQARANAIANLVLDSAKLVEAAKSHHFDMEEIAKAAATPPWEDETGPGLEKP